MIMYPPFQLFRALTPYLLIAVVGAGIAYFSNTYGYKRGKAEVQVQWDRAAVAQQIATTNALLEQSQQFQIQLEEAHAQHTQELARAKSDAAGARAASERLRSDLATTRARLAKAPRETVIKYAVATGDVFEQSVEAYRELAEVADGHVADIRLMQTAWPVSTFTEHLDKKDAEHSE